MKCKINIIILCLTVLTTALSAQEYSTLDIVHTVSGGTWKGQIKAWGQDTVHFQTLSGVDITFRTIDIKRVRQRLVGDSKVKKQYAFDESGIYQTVQLGLSSGPEGGMSATYVIGHRFNRLLSLGVGTGYENFEFGDARRVVPLFVESRGFLKAKKITPYYAARAGYGIALRSQDRFIVRAKGGPMFNPEFGVRFSGNEGANFYAGVGAHFQKATYFEQFPWNEDRIVDRYWFQRTEIKIGWVF